MRRGPAEPALKITVGLEPAIVLRNSLAEIFGFADVDPLDVRSESCALLDDSVRIDTGAGRDASGSSGYGDSANPVEFYVSALFHTQNIAVFDETDNPFSAIFLQFDKTLAVYGFQVVSFRQSIATGGQDLLGGLQLGVRFGEPSVPDRRGQTMMTEQGQTRLDTSGGRRVEFTEA